MIVGKRVVISMDGGGKKCGHKFTTEYVLADHRHREEDGETYVYCPKCSGWVTIEEED